jgi:biotin operon repressor
MQERVGKMSSMKDLLDRNIILRGADILTAKGFTQVPNHVLESEKLSPGAKLTFAMLLKYAWQNDYCFPGQERLAKDMGAGVRSIVRHVQELETAGYITIKRQGLGKPNIYEINLQRSKNRKR